MSELPSLPSRILVTDLPDEILLLIADYLRDTRSSEPHGTLVSLSQTCRAFRRVAYPLSNRHLYFDEEYWPTMLLDMVIYSFTDPLVEFVRSATFKLRNYNEYFLGDEEIAWMDEGLPVLKNLLKERAAVGDDMSEAYEFFESQIDECREAALPTIMLFQLHNLKEIELACTISATSSRFMIIVLHYFDPPCKHTLDKMSMVRLVDFEPANYWILERFLKYNIRKVGIDQRFGSTGAHPKLAPPKFWQTRYVDSEPGSEADGYEEERAIGVILPSTPPPPFETVISNLSVAGAAQPSDNHDGSAVVTKTVQVLSYGPMLGIQDQPIIANQDDQAQEQVHSSALIPLPPPPLEQGGSSHEFPILASEMVTPGPTVVEEDAGPSDEACVVPNPQVISDDTVILHSGPIPEIATLPTQTDPDQPSIIHFSNHYQNDETEEEEDMCSEDMSEDMSIAGESEENNDDHELYETWSRRYAFSEGSAVEDFEELEKFNATAGWDQMLELAQFEGYITDIRDASDPIDYRLPGSNNREDIKTETPTAGELVLWIDEMIDRENQLLILLGHLKGIKKLDVRFFPWSGYINPDDGGQSIECQWLTLLMQNSVKTLEYISFRVWPITAQPWIQPFKAFTALKEVVLAWGLYLDRQLMAHDQADTSFIEHWFPEQLERLEFLIVGPRRVEIFAKDAFARTKMQFPRLKIEIGFTKTGQTVAENLRRMWILRNNNTEKHLYVPVDFSVISRSHISVSKVGDGWYGPFQEDKDWRQSSTMLRNGMWAHREGDTDFESDDHLGSRKNQADDDD